MTYPAWPAELNRVLIDGYSAAYGDSRMTTPAESGPPRVRRKYSRVGRPVSLPMAFTLDQKMRFERFWFEEINEGAQYFTILNPELDDVPLADDSGAIITDDAGIPIALEETWLCLIGEAMPEFTPFAGTHWQVVITITVMP